MTYQKQTFEFAGITIKNVEVSNNVDARTKQPITYLAQRGVASVVRAYLRQVCGSQNVSVRCSKGSTAVNVFVNFEAITEGMAATVAAICDTFTHQTGTGMCDCPEFAEPITVGGIIINTGARWVNAYSKA